MDWKEQISKCLQEATEKSASLQKIADEMSARLVQLEKSSSALASEREQENGGIHVPKAELDLLMRKLEAVEVERQSLKGSAESLSERMSRIEQPQVAKSNLLEEQHRLLLQEHAGLKDNVGVLELKLAGYEADNLSLRRELDAARAAPLSPERTSSSSQLIEKLQADLYTANTALRAAKDGVPQEVHRQACQEYEERIMDLQARLPKSTNGTEALPATRSDELVLQELRMELSQSVQEAQDAQFRLRQLEQALVERDQRLAEHQQAMAEGEQKLVLAEQAKQQEKVMLEQHLASILQKLNLAEQESQSEKAELEQQLALADEAKQRALLELEQKLAVVEQELGVERDLRQKIQSEMSNLAGKPQIPNSPQTKLKSIPSEQRYMERENSTDTDTTTALPGLQEVPSPSRRAVRVAYTTSAIPRKLAVSGQSLEAPLSPSLSYPVPSTSVSIPSSRPYARAASALGGSMTANVTSAIGGSMRVSSQVAYPVQQVRAMTYSPTAAYTAPYPAFSVQPLTPDASRFRNLGGQPVLKKHYST